MVFGLGPMGCIPLQRVLSTSGNCQEKTNKLALSFNKASSKVVNDLEKQLPNASYRFGDAYDVVNDVISNPSKYGKYNINFFTIFFFNFLISFNKENVNLFCFCFQRFV